jgi:hypothetical protein
MSKVRDLHRPSPGAPIIENGKVPPRRVRNQAVRSREYLTAKA